MKKINNPMRKTNKFRTICEVLRECYFMTQPDQKELRDKLIEAQVMAKKMSKKLLEYNKKVFKNWWEKNKDYEEDLKIRDEETKING